MGAEPFKGPIHRFSLPEGYPEGTAFLADVVGFTRNGMETPPATLDYIGIVATNDFFISIKGVQNTSAKFLSGKLYGYRAVADASIYAALVQSEVLSA